MDLPHLKLGKTGNAKYRRRVTSAALRAHLGKAAIEWSLGTRDPLKLVDAWKAAHARYEALEAQAEGRSVSELEWDMTLNTAMKYGLARADATKIGPVNSELEFGKFMEFTEAIRAEAKLLPAQQLNAKFANNPPPNPVIQLVRAKFRGVERPAVHLNEALKHYLSLSEATANYVDKEKQTKLVVATLEEAMGEKNPRVVDIDRDAAQSFINVLRSRSNAISTIRRRVASIKALLNTTSKRYDLPDWDNPFNKIDLPRDDGDAGEDKRRSLTFDDIRKIRDHLAGVNDDARDIWHLMLFTGLGPSEARGLMWSEVFLDAPTPHFEVRPNGARRRLKRGERRRRVPLVGSAIKMMAARKRNAEAEEVYVFPRYAKHANANTLSAVLIKPMKVSGVWQTNVKVPYSLRHTLKDLLRRKAPVNMQLLLLGHGFGEGRVASGYGEDDLLDMQAKYLVEALSFGGFIAYPEMPSHGAKPR